MRGNYRIREATRTECFLDALGGAVIFTLGFLVCISLSFI